MEKGGLDGKDQKSKRDAFIVHFRNDATQTNLCIFL